LVVFDCAHVVGHGEREARREAKPGGEQLGEDKRRRRPSRSRSRSRSCRPTAHATNRKNKNTNRHRERGLAGSVGVFVMLASLSGWSLPAEDGGEKEEKKWNTPLRPPRTQKMKKTKRRKWKGNQRHPQTQERLATQTGTSNRVETEQPAAAQAHRPCLAAAAAALVASEKWSDLAHGTPHRWQ
jgi:hypothetical protein